jgi:hypothetical protein
MVRLSRLIIIVLAGCCATAASGTDQSILVQTAY